MRAASMVYLLKCQRLSNPGAVLEAEDYVKSMHTCTVQQSRGDLLAYAYHRPMRTPRARGFGTEVVAVDTVPESVANKLWVVVAECG